MDAKSRDKWLKEEVDKQNKAINKVSASKTSQKSRKVGSGLRDHASGVTKWA